MNPVKFWLVWMKIIVIAVLLLGVMTIFFADSPLMIIFNGPVQRVFIDKIGVSEELDQLIRLMEAAMGSVLIAWAIMMYFIIHYPLKKGEIWAWNSLFWSVTVWYVLHTGISLYYNMNTMVIFNTIVFLQAIAPLMIIRNSIFQVKKIRIQ